MEYKKKFKEWYLKFASSILFANMAAVKESSPWHREDNIGVHTNMVVQDYVERSPEHWTKKDFLGAVHCAFHDTGKPKAEEIIEKEDGSIRKRYGGHEIYSARFFVDFVYSDPDLLDLLDDCDIYNIAVMIQSHIPYSLSQKKLRQLKTHITVFGLEDVFVRCLLADTYGRISDDQESKRTQACHWAKEYFLGSTEALELINEKVPTVMLICAPTGSGKSTIVKDLIVSYETLNKKVGVHSMDQCRLDWYSPDYEDAYRLAVADKKFNGRVMSDYSDKIKTNDVVIVDNTNLSPKRRRRYLTGDNTHATVLLLDYATNYSRFMNRTDKKIGKFVLDQMYWNFKLPILGEVDKIFIISKTGGLKRLCSMS